MEGTGSVLYRHPDAAAPGSRPAAMAGRRARGRAAPPSWSWCLDAQAMLPMRRCRPFAGQQGAVQADPGPAL